MTLQSSLEIQERMDALGIEAKAINLAAEKDERELTTDEQLRWSAVMEAESGELAKAKVELAQAKKREGEQKVLADLFSERTGGDGASASLMPAVETKAKMFAPQVVHYGSLKAFKGANAREDAYRCGVHLAALLLGNRTAQQRCSDLGLDVRAAMTEGSNISGGYLVLPEFEQTVIDLRIEYGVFGRFAKRRPMASDVQSIPRRKSGLTAYAVGENVEITESQKAWSQVEVTAKKWGVLSLYSTELDEDAFISMADDLAGEMAYALVTKEDQSGFIGDGTSTYHGITGVVNTINDGNHAGSILTAATGNTDFETLDYKDFRDTVMKLPNFPGLQQVWHCTRAAFYQSMDRLAIAAGGNTRADFEDGPHRQFMGFPVVFNEVMNSTAGADTAAIKFLFGDIGMAATFGTRRDLRVDVTKDRYFELDQIGIKGTTRWGISVHDVGDSSNAGPVVALKTPAS